MTELTDAAADDALADVLTGTESAVSGEVVAADHPALPECTRAEAEELVNRARTAISELDAAMTDIIRRQAWKALGYDSPQSFWLKEFGRTDDRPGGLSRAHLYRTARVLAVLYGLVDRLGDDALAISISERALREIPRNDGEGDVELMNAIESRVEKLGADYTTDDIQKAVDEEIAAARKRVNTAETGGPSMDELADELASFGFDTSQLRGQPAREGEGDDDLWDGEGDPTDEQPLNAPPEAAAGSGAELTQMESGVGSGPLHVANVRRAIVMLCEAGEDWTEVSSLMSASELAELSAAAGAAIKVLESLRDHQPDDDLVEVDIDDY